jgi:hypothetical protein
VAKVQLVRFPGRSARLAYGRQTKPRDVAPGTAGPHALRFHLARDQVASCFRRAGLRAASSGKHGEKGHLKAALILRLYGCLDLYEPIAARANKDVSDGPLRRNERGFEPSHLDIARCAEWRSQML